MDKSNRQYDGYETRLQNYIHMVVGKHGTQTFKVLIVLLLLLLLSFDVFVLTNAYLLLVLIKWFVQIYLKYQFIFCGPPNKVVIFGIIYTFKLTKYHYFVP